MLSIVGGSAPDDQTVANCRELSGLLTVELVTHLWSCVVQRTRVRRRFGGLADFRGTLDNDVPRSLLASTGPDDNCVQCGDALPLRQGAWTHVQASAGAFLL